MQSVLAVRECRGAPSPVSVGDCFRHLVRNPGEMLIARWNWKSALFSSLCRGFLFFFANLHVGLNAASGAMLTEFAYRGVTAGFYGAVTQAFRSAEPRRRAALMVALGVPLASHAIEFTIHWLRGTADLRTSISASVVFTVLSTLFNLHAMRKGVLVVGDGGKPLDADFRSLPGAIASFVASGFGLRTAQ